jgi:hypothetical protein
VRGAANCAPPRRLSGCRARDVVPLREVPPGGGGRLRTLRCSSHVTAVVSTPEDTATGAGLRSVGSAFRVRPAAEGTSVDGGCTPCRPRRGGRCGRDDRRQGLRSCPRCSGVLVIGLRLDGGAERSGASRAALPGAPAGGEVKESRRSILPGAAGRRIVLQVSVSGRRAAD